MTGKISNAETKRAESVLTQYVFVLIPKSLEVIPSTLIFDRRN